jgi:hypothetical protein
MTQLAYLVTLGWVLVGIVLFMKRDKRRACLLVVLLGWLFLPVMRTTSVSPGEPLALSLPGLKFTKANAIAYAVLAGAMLFDRKRWLSLRPGLVDLPMLCWCICPLISSLSNDLGWYDGLSSVLDQVMGWGVLYRAGRVYFRTLDEFRELALAILTITIIYMPLCWFEMRMSPQLHNILYGYLQHEFSQTVRLGGYRPMVFLPHPLVVAMWMCMASVLLFWLWYCGAVKKIRGIPMIGSVSAQLALGMIAMTSLMCRSMAAIVFCFTGMLALLLSRWTQSALLLGALLIVSPIYISVRATGIWTGEDLVEWLEENVSQDRADSLRFRMDNENILAAKAIERPWFGWAGWGRSRVLNEWGQDISVTDGGWIIAFGERGLFGLVAWCIVILLPSARFLKDVPPRLWSHPQIAPLAAVAAILILNTVNNMLNVDTDPVYVLAIGGMMSVMDTLTVPSRARAAEPTLRRRRQPVTQTAPA